MKEKKIIKFGLWFILIAAFSFKIFLLYYIYWHRQYLVPPGSDVVVHYQIIKDILRTGQMSFDLYPPGFHLLVIFFSKLFHLDVLTILTQWTPVLILLPPLAMFYLLRQLFSLKVSVLATVILIFSAGYPLYGFADGNYPDMLAYGVFWVLLLAFLVRYFKTQKPLNLLWSGILLILIALTHHFTFFNIAVILAIFGLLQFYLALNQSQLPKPKKIFLGVWIIFFILALGYILTSIFYQSVALHYVERFFSHLFQKGASYIKTPVEFLDYSSLMGNLVWYLGLAGFFYVVVSVFTKKEDAKTKQLLIIWLLFFYILSRFSSSGIPARFAREIALPLVVSIAYFLQYLLDQNSFRSRMGQILAVGFLGYLMVMNSSLYTGPAKIPNGFDEQVWFRPIDQIKIDYLQTKVPANQSVLYNPSANLFFRVKSENNKTVFALNDEEKKIVDQYLNSPKSAVAKSAYNQLIAQKQKQYQDIDFIFNDVQPPGNTNPVVYPLYAGYNENKQFLNDLAVQYQRVKSFDDGAVLYGR